MTNFALLKKNYINPIINLGEFILHIFTHHISLQQVNHGASNHLKLQSKI